MQMLAALMLAMAAPAAVQSEPTPANPVAESRDSVEAQSRAVLAISEFFVGWQRLWRVSEQRREDVLRTQSPMKVRLAYVHCHQPWKSAWGGPPPPRPNDGITRVFPQFLQIPSNASEFAVCPSWILGPDIPQANDESEWRDGAIVPSLRKRAFDARALLIGALDSALTSWPGSAFLNGQAVRFRVDQRDFEGAAKTARNCRAIETWCLALSGYVSARRGAIVQADATYAAMRASMSAVERCRWQDVRTVLAPADTLAFITAGCGERERTVGTLWWLSDPLYRVSGNDRLVAHETRKVEVELHRMLDVDERYPWKVKLGGDAMAQLVERYGWPTYTAWGGSRTDASHSAYLSYHREGWLTFMSVPVFPYTTFEYSMNRARLMPTFTASRQPFAMRATDWSIAEEATDGSVSPNWWPHEHASTGRRLVQLPEGQTAMFRRQSHVILATAHRFFHPLLYNDSLRFDAMLLTSTGPNRVDSLDQRVVKGGETVVLQANTKSEPQLIAVEALGVGTTRVDARTRFGITTPDPLSAMQPRTIAISDPALIDVRGDTVNMQLPDESMIDHLMGTVSLGGAQRRVGLYWETYGVAAADTVTVTVSMASEADLSVARRVGVAINMAADPRRSLQISWTEPSSLHNTRTLVGPVPVQMRSLVLNLSQLTPGPYVLSVSIDKKGVGVATSQRRVVVTP